MEKRKLTEEESIQLINDTIRQIKIDFPANNAYANSYTVKSITGQLQYIKEALDNKNDRSKLNNLTLGLLAAKELEPGYENLTDKIYKVCGIVRQMQVGGFSMNIKEKLETLGKNAIDLKIAEKEKYEPGATRFGGRPDVPSDFVWPTYRGESFLDKTVKDLPLSFLAQFNCEKLKPFDTEHLLPDHGLLSFFYEMDTQCWGFNPKDKGCARVYWFEDISTLSAANFPEEMEDDFKFPMVRISPDSKISYPSWADFSDVFPDEDYDAFNDAWDELTGENRSWLLGWPDVIQNSMFAECDLVTQCYYLGSGRSKVPKETRQKAEESACDRWMLLFQLDTVECDDFYLMFGDAGHIYFYITKEDLAARRFDRVWLILQCH